jgi:hypothetical protein
MEQRVMKLTVQCLECFNKAITIPFARRPSNPEQHISNVRSFIGYEVELSEDFTYELSCIEGHEQITILKTPRFEVLLQVSLNAVLDGYYRDAVASSASALERFYEYYLNVRSIYKRIDENIFQETWKKNLGSSSERQMGAYAMAYTLVEGAQPQTLETVDNISGRCPTKFRNDVIHKGYMPTRVEAIQFIDRIISIIHPVLIQLRATCLAEIEDSENAIYEDKLSKAKEKRRNRPIAWYRYHIVIGPNHKANLARPDVEDLLLQLDTFRRPLSIVNQLALNGGT